jgi:hypothetical protein
MDALVIDHYGCHTRIVSAKEHTEEIDGSVALPWQVRVAYDEHLFV